MDIRPSQSIKVDDVKLVKNELGFILKWGWMSEKKISEADAIRVRDWLNVNYPVKLCKCEPQ